MDTPEQPPRPQPVTEFKPNINPIIYWALAFGVTAGLVLFVMYLMSQYLTLLWFPVFAVCAALGAYRNYKKQKQEWLQANGLPQQKKPLLDEVKEAFQDIADASRGIMNEEQQPPVEAFPPQEQPQFSEQEPPQDARNTEDNPPVPPLQPPR